MTIYLAISQEETANLLTSRLHLYNLQPKIWDQEVWEQTKNPRSLDSYKTVTSEVDLLITDQELTLKHPQLRVLRLEIDLKIPGDEDLLYQLSTSFCASTPEAAKAINPLVIVVGVTGKSGVTRLVTHPRLTSFTNSQTNREATRLIRVNLLEDPSFSERLRIPFTTVTWQGEETAVDFIPQRLPTGEVVIDADFFKTAPADKLAKILRTLATQAPVVVDAGRLSAATIHLAKESDAQLVVATTKHGYCRLFKRLKLLPLFFQMCRRCLTVEQLQQKWNLTLITSWKELRNLLERKDAVK
ncbi:hypothetical protein NXS08_04490 [Gleimia sp. 6138-11-ORH1]|uniref:hypothetical protein n=1 Tax=Gleimia sp. 6138-11-ORH1 TaxID=2973937 RepID=UPI0021693A2D|nr:hypothetical protein [Gleimia sp. 6138-11-ORH1]MCS4484737.1 hypothetical protein [Gleimia sp. 6138-11-ORH1]